MPTSLSPPGFPSSTRRTLSAAALFRRASAVHASRVAQVDALHYLGVGARPRPPLKGGARAPALRRATLDYAVRLLPSRHGHPHVELPCPVASLAV
jgi:hypothetical protein